MCSTALQAFTSILDFKSSVWTLVTAVLAVESAVLAVDTAQQDGPLQVPAFSNLLAHLLCQDMLFACNSLSYMSAGHVAARQNIEAALQVASWPWLNEPGLSVVCCGVQCSV